MIAIIRQKDGEITGWIIAQNLTHARRRALQAMDNVLAQKLYRMESPPEGRTDLGDGDTMFVENY